MYTLVYMVKELCCVLEVNISLLRQNYKYYSFLPSSIYKNMFIPLLSSFCFSFLQISCQRSLVHLSWNKQKHSFENKWKKGSWFHIKRERFKRTTYCIHWCISALTLLFGQIITGLSQTVRTQDSDFTLERRVSNVLEMTFCMRGTERRQILLLLLNIYLTRLVPLRLQDLFFEGVLAKIVAIQCFKQHTSKH